MIRIDDRGVGRRWATALMVAGALCTAPARAAPESGAASCRPGPARTDTLDGIGLRGEIRLGSGARAILDSLRWPDIPDVAEAVRLWLDARRGASLIVVPRGQPDRWGRERADIELVDSRIAARDPDLAGGLIAAGLAFADANELDRLCRPALRLVEAAARETRLGLWRDPLPLATDGPALRALVGRFAVLEGRIRHVGERSARTYLDFAARGGDGLTVTVSKRTWRMVRARGLSATALEGRRVRVRGILDVWRGPTLEVTADAIEVLDAGVLDAGVLDEPDRPQAGPAGEQGLRR